MRKRKKKENRKKQGVIIATFLTKQKLPSTLFSSFPSFFITAATTLSYYEYSSLSSFLPLIWHLSPFQPISLSIYVFLDHSFPKNLLFYSIFPLFFPPYLSFFTCWIFFSFFLLLIILSFFFPSPFYFTVFFFLQYP